MPELPDITVYLEALEPRVLSHVLEHVQIAGPSLLRTADPAPQAAEGRTVMALRRIGKRIAIGFDNGLWLVLHLMIAGRLHWNEKPKRPDGRRTLAAFLFDSGCLTLTEAGTRKRASLHVVQGRCRACSALDPGGIDVRAAPLEDFAPGTHFGEPHRSSARSPTRAYSRASATPIPTKSCIARACRR